MTTLLDHPPDTRLAEVIEDYVVYRTEGQNSDAIESMATMLGLLCERVPGGITRGEVGHWVNKHAGQRVVLDEHFYQKAVDCLLQQGIFDWDGTTLKARPAPPPARVPRSLPSVTEQPGRTRQPPSRGTAPTLHPRPRATEPTRQPPSRGTAPTLHPRPRATEPTRHLDRRATTMTRRPGMHGTAPTAHPVVAGTAPTATSGGKAAPSQGRADTNLQAGAQLVGEQSYTLVDMVGQGGMGQVWKAHVCDRQQRVVAIKTVRTQSAALEQALHREVALLRKLNRPDLFPVVHESFRANGQVFMVMDWVEGRTLRDEVGRGLLNIDRFRFFSILDQVVDRLAYLHAWQPRPIVFRDLKPSNVMLDAERDHLRLVDFGISHVVVEGQDDVGAHTPGWIAPEVARGLVTPLTDVFALGRLALYLMFGHDQLSQLGPEARVPDGPRRDLPDALVVTAQRLSDPNPSHRPPTVLAALRLLKRAGDAQSGPRPDRGTPCPTCGRALLARHVFCIGCGQTPDKAKPPNRGAPRISLRYVSPQLPQGASPEGAPAEQEALEGLLEIRARADLGTLQCLPTISVQPYRYQQQAAIRVISEMGGRALIADDVGLGKTIEAGLVIKECLHRGMARRVLIVSPPGLLLEQIQQEMRDKFHLEFRQYRGGALANLDDTVIGPSQLAEHDHVIVSLHTLRRDANLSRFKGQQWDMMVVDECHHIKSRSSKSYKAIRQITPRYVLFMSATPFSGKAEELWTVYSALRPGWLAARFKDFTAEYFPNAYRGHMGRPSPELQPRIRNLTIRRSRRQILVKFPKRKAVRVALSVDAEFRWRYRALAQAASDHSKSFLDRAILMQQACSSWESLQDNRFWERVPSELRTLVRGLRDDDHPKVRWLLETVLPRIPVGEKALIFTRFRASQRSLKRILGESGYRVDALIDTSGSRRTRMLHDFLDGDKVQFLICGEGAGEGLNLQRASLLINYDLPWNPMRVEQRIGRIQRLGQRRTYVNVVNMVVPDTVEAQVLEVMERKIELFNHMMGDTEQILGELFGADDTSGEKSSFEGWIAGALMPDGLVGRRALDLLGQALDEAKRKARLRATEGKGLLDEVFDTVDDVSAGGPAPDLPGFDLSGLGDV